MRDDRAPKHVVMRQACDRMLYASHGPRGLTHWVFEDGTMLVSYRWGERFLTVDPSDPASWSCYLARMEHWGLGAHLTAALNTYVCAAAFDRQAPGAHVH